MAIKKNIIIGSVIVVAVIGFLILSSQSASAATLTTQANADFDKYMLQLQNYVAQQSGIVKMAMEGAVSLIQSQKSTIVAKAVSSGQPIYNMLPAQIQSIITK